MFGARNDRPLRRSQRHAGLPLLALTVLTCLFSAGAAAATEPVETVQRLHLIWTNDIHGHIASEGARFMNPNFPPPLGGAASAARYVKTVRAAAAAAGELVMMVDVGDFYQGTPIGNKSFGEAVVDYFNYMSYDLVVPGNHEFDLGRDVVAKLAQQAQMPFLAANLVEESTGEVVEWCLPTLMLDKGGIKIGVVGIITPGTEHMSFPDNIAGLQFLPMPETIARYRDELRAAGADLICLAIHEGLPFDPVEGWANIATTREEAGEQAGGTYGLAQGEEYINLMELVNLVPGIDFAIGGHTHRGYTKPWIDPLNHTLCFETFGNGSSLGHAILKFDTGTRSLIGYEAPHDRGVIITLHEDELWPDAEMAEQLRPWLEKTDAEMNQVVGQSAVNLGRGDAGSNLVGNLVTDAMRSYFDADFAVQNNGGLRADISSGDITARDVFSVLPFGNQLLVVKMNGAMLRRIVERKVSGSSGGICISGAEMSFDTSRQDYDRVVKFEVGGQPLDLERTYRVVLTNYLMEGNSGLDFLTAVPETDIELTQITTAEAVEHYLRENSPVRPRIDQRWLDDRGAHQAPYLAAPYLPDLQQ
ncbi:MAG: bifunctional UDP-sugar hydrolase/5'-nucleotidase [bacterium]